MVIRNGPFAYPQSGSPAHGVPGKFPFNSSRSTQAKDNSVAIRPIVIHGNPVPVSYTHLTLPTIYSV